MKFTATGDFLIHNGIPAQHPGVDAIASYIREADVRMTNLETTITAKPCYTNAYYCDTLLTTDPAKLDEVKRFGIEVCGCANNHSTDFGPDGLMETIHWLDEAGLKHCGTGSDLREASAPATVNTAEGSVALFSHACVNRKNESGRAGIEHDGIPGRPGVNALRRIEESLVTKEEMAFIRDLAKRTMVNAQEDLEKAYGVGELDDGTFSYGMQKFVLAEKTGKNTRCNETDMARAENAIRDAKLYHRYAVSMVHSHQFKALREDEPDYYLEEFAHRCIDAGSDAVVCTGNHLLKGIEIYKDRPVFYGLGNFIFQTEYVSRTSGDMMEMLGFPLSLTGAEVSRRRVEKGSASMERNQVFFLSVVPQWTITDGKLTDITLLPVELGLKEPWGLKGLPSPCAPEMVFEHLQEVCAPMGTKLAIDGGTIKVVL